MDVGLTGSTYSSGPFPTSFLAPSGRESAVVERGSRGPDMVTPHNPPERTDAALEPDLPMPAWENCVLHICTYDICSIQHSF